MENSDSQKLQKTIPNKKSGLIVFPEDFPDTLTWWAEQYFNLEVTTSKTSQKEQARDIAHFINYLKREIGDERRELWIPRQSKAFQEHMRNVLKKDGRRQWSDRSINRMLAHLKTFSKWIHKLRPFPLGNPMQKIKLLSVGIGLDIERALTPAERNRMLDAADRLLVTGGQSEDRHRYRKGERPVRKGFRPYRNRAIIYTLIETGMRRGAVPRINLEDVNFKDKTVSAQEKGELMHQYKISNQGLEAIRDYIQKEREQDNEVWQSSILFLPPRNRPNAGRQLTPCVINSIWNAVAEKVGLKGKTPHSARHAMGKHIIEKTGNIAAVQRQLGHKNAMYSMLYSRITAKELEGVLNDRE